VVINFAINVIDEYWRYILLGTIVNTLAIIAGSLVGLIFRGGIPEKYNETVLQAVSLAVIMIGLRGALKTDAVLIVIISLAIGSVIGEMIKIDDGLKWLGKCLEVKLAKEKTGIAKGFVTASLIFCVGSMAIVGSMESGLTGNHQTLYAKSALDGITSIIFASTFGIGVIFSAVTVFIYQGIITIMAFCIKPFLTTEVINQMSAVGGLLIMAIGFNMLNIVKIRIANMLPAVFMPLFYYMLCYVYQRI